MSGKKFDGGKPQMDLLPTKALVEVAKVLTYGAGKYDRFNWRKGMKWSRLIAASMRHLTSFNDGQDKDLETNISHLAHCACNLMFLLEYEKTHKELDDRYNDKIEKQNRKRTLTRSNSRAKKRKSKPKKTLRRK